MEKEASYDPETGEVLNEGKPERRDRYPIEDTDDVADLMYEVLDGRVTASAGVAYLTGALIKQIPIKRWQQEQIFSIFTESHRKEIFADSYLKSTYSQTKMDTRLKLEMPKYHELHDELDKTNGLMNALTIAIDAVKMIDRSSWGRNRAREER